MNEDEMRDKIYQDLMMAMDDMSAKKPVEKESITVAVSNPSGPVKKPQIINKSEADQLKESEADMPGNESMKPSPSPALEGAQSMAEEEDKMPGNFKGFMRMKRKG